jgi:hypothetical protein
MPTVKAPILLHVTGRTFTKRYYTVLSSSCADKHLISVPMTATSIGLYYDPLDFIECDLVAAAVVEHGGFGAGVIGDVLGFFDGAAVLAEDGDAGGAEGVAGNRFGQADGLGAAWNLTRWDAGWAKRPDIIWACRPPEEMPHGPTVGCHQTRKTGS